MKFVVGIQTCERLSFLKKCVDSIVKYNPELMDAYFIIGDDASKDKRVDEYINSLDFVDQFIKNKERKGISITLKKITESAEKSGDILLYVQNDFFLDRTIDMASIEAFFQQYGNAGHIQTMRNKGLKGTNKRFVGTRSYINGKKTKDFDTINIGKEQFTLSSRNYCDYPNFTRTKLLHHLWKDFDPNNVAKKAEIPRAKNFHNICDIYILENQPFWNADTSGSRNRTKGRLS